MSLLNDASLVFIPSGYKEDKVYSIIPSNGAGDLDFVRGCDATRINPQSLVEGVSWNLIGYSSDLSNAYWTKRGFTQLATNAIAPDGSGTAYKIQENNTDNNPGLVITSNVTPNGANTFSVWLKGDSNFTLNLSTNGGVAGTTINITTSWQLFTVTQTDVAYFGPHIGGFGSITRNSGVVLYAWHPQLNIGSTAKPYFPTTDRLNVPRLDYTNSTCPSLLLEKQSTNIFTYSEEFNNGAWSKIGSTITANNIISPDGTMNADKLVETAINGIHYLERLQTFSASDSISIFAKAGERTQIGIGNAVAGASIFDLSNGTLISSGGSLINNEKIENYGNGWYRISANLIFAGAFSAQIFIANSGSISYNGNGTSGIYIWGAQLETGSYPTSYIPTTSATATRLADSCSKTGISSLIGQTEGTMFVDYNYDAKPDISGNIPMIIYNGSNEAYIYITNGADIRLELYNAGVLQCLLTTSIGAVGRKKIAFAYKQNDFIGYMNGVQIAADTSGTVGAMSTLYVGGYYTANYNVNGGINQALLFKRRLTNTELANLTTL